MKRKLKRVRKQNRQRRFAEARGSTKYAVEFLMPDSQRWERWQYELPSVEAARKYQKYMEADRNAVKSRVIEIVTIERIL